MPNDGTCSVKGIRAGCRQGARVIANQPRARSRARCRWLVVLIHSFLPVLPAGLAAPPPAAPSTTATDDLLGKTEIPAAWRARFWASPGGQAFLKLQPKPLADLVPAQSGLRFCRCPDCGAAERDEPLVWSLAEPAHLKCRRCGVVVPNGKYPAKGDKKEPPEETVEVLPGLIHHYPYHAVEEGKTRYPDERLYLQARIDYEKRKYLAKAALYAAAEYRAQPPAARDHMLALRACVLMLRFAQVYPAYATHLDQPDGPKYFQPARLQPPYRRNYQTGKWEWKGCLDVPMNLLIAYALLRQDPAWSDAGRLLEDPAPCKTVERDFLRAAAEFTRAQPEEFSEESLHVYRGLVAVGRLTGEQALVIEARSRLDGFLRRSFYHDGMWREAQSQAQRRVVDLLDGWVGVMPFMELESPEAARAGATAQPSAGRLPAGPGHSFLELAQSASGMKSMGTQDPQLRQASWRSGATAAARRPLFLGGAGVARLALGQGRTALDLDLRGLDTYGGPHFQRLALRLAVAGTPVLDDLDENSATSRGWELATASHNTVVIDGLNQRETPRLAHTPAAGSRFLFFAADPDFQVASAEDPRAIRARRRGIATP